MRTAAPTPCAALAAPLVLQARRALPRRCAAVVKAAAAAPAAPAANQSAVAGSVEVTFSLSRKVEFGQDVLIVGSHETLGAWQLDGAARCSWKEGDVWEASVDLPAGAELEYKFVVADPSHPPQWESRVNRTLTVDATAAVLSGAWEEDLAPVAVAVSYDADDEEEAQQAQQQQAAAQVAEEEEAAVATVTEAPAPAKPESPQRTLKLSPAAEAAVGGLIEQANAAAYKVAEGLAAMSADEAAADAVATAGLVGAAQARSAKSSKRNTAKSAAKSAEASKPLPEQLGFSTKRRQAASKPKRGTTTKAQSTASEASQ